MIRLDLSRDPKWVDLGHGVRVLAAPLTSAVMMAARSDLREALPGDGGAAGHAAAVALVKAIARMVIRDWDGIGDTDGNPLPPTPERIDALLDLPPLYDAFERDLVGPALLLADEKNASAPSPNGISAGAAAIAKPARRRAKPAPTG
ncbi:hypothetical protein [Blastochloris viridis]|uniref:Uncharacterized protein n=1 Tax=Blastochloris viridis TaxID=1079 RepID=A0A0H5BQL1_BLAVI|nr:hypothetical protein [Blastochloris viridis]ALK09001.1 hypothetical protein BVIR_1212 [Blastochloris viridis]BAS01139.1 hypothetical protein BV133_3545 [Blastochloris viridis]CUU41662.1 hypothetical protein BVIRIDIS_06550 [Blastochloris viridis]